MKYRKGNYYYWELITLLNHIFQIISRDHTSKQENSASFQMKFLQEGSFVHFILNVCHNRSANDETMIYLCFSALTVFLLDSDSKLNNTCLSIIWKQSKILYKKNCEWKTFIESLIAEYAIKTNTLICEWKSFEINKCMSYISIYLNHIYPKIRKHL